MKRLFSIFVLLLFLANISMVAFATDYSDADVVSINPKDNVLKVNTTKTKYLDDKILDSDPERIKLIMKLQKEKDVEDLESLWKATVERNSAIKFALQKLSAPAEQRKVHSSMMAKTLSTLINGASLVPFMAGANFGLQSASLASGQIANRLISKKDMPKTMPLTDTELIQLSDLVEGLQNEVVRGYYDYKSSITSLKECREKLVVEQKNYSKALNQNNRFYMIVSSAVYDDKMLEEIQLREKVKLNRLKLERLAGHDAVEQLNLSKLVLNIDCKNGI